MRPRRFGRWALIGALLSTSYGVVGAQPTDGAEPPGGDLPIGVELRHLCRTATQGVRRLPDPGRARLVTVLPFAGGADRATGDVRRLVTDYLSVVCFGGLRDLVVVDATGQVAPDDPAPLAAWAAARGIDLVLSGRVTRGAVAYTVSARLLDARAAESVAAVMHPLPLEATDAYVEQTLRPRTPAAAVLRAAVVPGWGQFYNDEPAKGVLVISAEVILLAVAGAFWGARYDAWEAYQVEVPERVVHKADAERYGTWAIAAVSLAGAVWLGSILDAWLSGHRYDPVRAFETRGAVEPGTAAGAGALGFSW